MSKKNMLNSNDLFDSVPVPTPEPTRTPCDIDSMSVEDMKECVRRLSTQIELREREAERAAAKAAAEKAAAEKAAAEAEKARKDAEAKKAKKAASITGSLGFNGPGYGYKYLQPLTGTYGLTSDIWKAKQTSNGVYDPIWVWYSNGTIDHIMTDEELRKYVP